ncbi:hypothetical protein CV102_13935 [Natronococcus pandeyae]|uniref:Uncharacterized protein n=1 Tax=Natronococcus pandeyae TaxID=2055836 RepID=A0A8J8Q1R2_9EURY|nr:hypothetical protein CV102_13935 [Natronococcus pandeyae]
MGIQLTASPWLTGDVSQGGSEELPSEAQWISDQMCVLKELINTFCMWKCKIKIYHLAIL